MFLYFIYPPLYIVKCTWNQQTKEIFTIQFRKQQRKQNFCKKIMEAGTNLFMAYLSLKCTHLYFFLTIKLAQWDVVEFLDYGMNGKEISRKRAKNL